MAADTSEVSQLFTDLERCGIEGNYLKGLRIANKILEKIPKDKDAYQCKIVCFIQQGKLHDALQILKSNRLKKGLTLPFEEAYCCYRLNKTSEALEILTAIEEPTLREKELLAQVYYRLEQYQKCHDLYVDLIKNSQDDYGDERETNLAAVVAASKSLQDHDMNVEGLREDTYELCYNAACLSIAKGDIDEAADKLLMAEELCKKSMGDDTDLTEQEMEAELGVLRVQRGYTSQIQGKDEEAMKLYNQVLKSRPNDIAISAVASNNVVSLNKDRDIFDSKKKIKVATADGSETKLNHRQKQHVAFNKCLVLLYSNQNDACRKLAVELQDKYPESDFPILVQAAIFYRDKQHSEAISILEAYRQSHPKCSMQVTLTLVQLHLVLGNTAEACMRLRSIESICHRPGVVAALVKLYTHAGDVESAVQVLDDAVAHAKKNEATEDEEGLKRLLRENVTYKLKQGKTKEAVSVLEYLHDLDPDDLKTIAHLVAAYSQIDAKKAELYSSKLPPLEGDKVDVDALEVSLGTRYARKITKTTAEGAKDKPTVGERLQDVVAKRRRKKKPGKLPKNYNRDVDPDPERWLPRRERSYFKGKRQKKSAAIGKGTQGATASQESPSARASSSPKASSPPGTPGGTASTAGVVPPRQQQPQASKKKQRSKKKKGGW